MAELTPQERLQPALLDRLTDDEPANRAETREQRVMSRARMRQAVLRDLAWLFNAVRPGSEIDFSAAPQARHSVLNFGLPALSGSSASMLEAGDLEKRIRDAIRDFEPRILPETLRVRAIVSEDALAHHNVIGIEIQGQLWAQPVPLELLVRTEIDLETGKVEIADVAGSRGN
jgi:type VI secretion system protein ImpF